MNFPPLIFLKRKYEVLFKYIPNLKSGDEQRQISPQKGENEVKADE